MPHAPKELIVTASDTLIIRGVQHGRTWTWDTEQKPRGFADIQSIIDGLVDVTSDVVSVWRVETNERGTPIIIDDISELFDLRTAEQISEDAYDARERAFAAPAYRQPYSTLNHVSQGIGR